MQKNIELLKQIINDSLNESKGLLQKPKEIIKNPQKLNLTFNPIGLMLYQIYTALDIENISAKLQSSSQASLEQDLINIQAIENALNSSLYIDTDIDIKQGLENKLAVLEEKIIALKNKNFDPGNIQVTSSNIETIDKLVNKLNPKDHLQNQILLTNLEKFNLGINQLHDKIKLTNLDLNTINKHLDSIENQREQFEDMFNKIKLKINQDLSKIQKFSLTDYSEDLNKFDQSVSVAINNIIDNINNLKINLVKNLITNYIQECDNIIEKTNNKTVTSENINRLSQHLQNLKNHIDKFGILPELLSQQLQILSDKDISFEKISSNLDLANNNQLADNFKKLSNQLTNIENIKLST